MTDLPVPRNPPRLCHPLLGMFPLAAMALATFLVTFAVLLARSSTGRDPAQLGGVATVALSGGARRTVTARASGGATAVSTAAAPAATAAAPASIAAAVATRSSGAAAAAEGHDG